VVTVHELDVLALGVGELVEADLAADDQNGSSVALGPEDSQAIEGALLGLMRRRGRSDWGMCRPPWVVGSAPAVGGAAW
jgi:hypothetical protein